MPATALRASIAGDIISGVPEGSLNSNFALRLPTGLLDALRVQAARQRTSVNGLMVALLAGGARWKLPDGGPLPRLSPMECGAVASVLEKHAPATEVRERVLAELRRVGQASEGIR
jgi:hypothetical protein